jgi:hypothetical protein
VLLLHLSDIHFRRKVTGMAMDFDRHLRNELLRDVEYMHAELGPVDAVLISGDIAFGGHPDEYKFALEWIDNLCQRCGCALENVFVCPGNHDVVRAVAGRWVIQGLHDKIKTARDLELQPLLRELLSDPEAGRLLYEPLDHYNLFAVQFFCDMLPPERTIARRNLTLNDGSTLQLVAFNSAFVSSAADTRGQLYVDPGCYQLERIRGVEETA